MRLQTLTKNMRQKLQKGSHGLWRFQNLLVDPWQFILNPVHCRKTCSGQYKMFFPKEKLIANLNVLAIHVIAKYFVLSRCSQIIFNKNQKKLYNLFAKLNIVCTFSKNLCFSHVNFGPGLYWGFFIL